MQKRRGNRIQQTGHVLQFSEWKKGLSKYGWYSLRHSQQAGACAVGAV